MPLCRKENARRFDRRITRVMMLEARPSPVKENHAKHPVQNKVLVALALFL